MKYVKIIVNEDRTEYRNMLYYLLEYLCNTLQMIGHTLFMFYISALYKDQ